MGLGLRGPLSIIFPLAQEPIDTPRCHALMMCNGRDRFARWHPFGRHKLVVRISDPFVPSLTVELWDIHSCTPEQLEYLLEYVFVLHH